MQRRLLWILVLQPIVVGADSRVPTNDPPDECRTDYVIPVEVAESFGFRIEESPETLDVSGQAQYGYLYTIHLPTTVDWSNSSSGADLLNGSRLLRWRDLPEYKPPNYFVREEDREQLCFNVVRSTGNECVEIHWIGYQYVDGVPPEKCSFPFPRLRHMTPMTPNKSLQWTQ